MTLSSERLEIRRRHLVEVAQALIRERGGAGFTMALLAERAGVSAATPYNLLGSKAEIIRLVLREDFARFVARVAGRSAGTPFATLLLATELLVDHCEADHAFHMGLLGADASALSTESRAWWRTLVQAAIDSGELAGVVRAGQLADMLLRTMGGVARTWLTERRPAARFRQEMGVAVRLVLAGVSTPGLREAMIARIEDLQTGSDAEPVATPAPPASATDRRTILASRAVIVAFRLFEQAARGAALTIPQYRFLLMLKRGPRRASDLAAFSGIGRPTASALIADMERCGLVTRTRSGGDGRAADLRVTGEGLHRYVVLEETLAAAFETLLGDDRDLILDTMARFSQGIDRRSRGRDPVDRVRDTNYPVAAGER